MKGLNTKLFLQVHVVTCIASALMKTVAKCREHKGSPFPQVALHRVYYSVVPVYPVMSR